MIAEHTGQPADRRVARLPRTIAAIGGALTTSQRLTFHAEVLQAPQGVELDEVMTRWWRQAMLGQVPGHEQRVAEALAGVNLHPLPGLVGDVA
jgi:hypothetical protein